MSSSRRRVSSFLVVSILATSPSLAMRPSVDLATLVDEVDLIVLARVEQVTEVDTAGEPNRWFGASEPLLEAVAEILETWKGPVAARVSYRASRSWTCDDSRAVVGETVLLFLSRGKERHYIDWNGIGRLPVAERSRIRCAAVPDDLILPARIGTVSVPGLSRRSVILRDLKRYVRSRRGLARFDWPD